METTSTHDSDFSTNSNTSIVLPDCSNSNSYDDDDEEDNKDMIFHARSVSYTSLKDLLHESQTSIMSPSGTNTHNNCYSSCYEIPIKNHLVKQAALAYLTPMSAPQPDGGSRWFDKLRDLCCCCCCGCGCFGWLKGVMFGGGGDDQGCDGTRTRRRRGIENCEKVD